MAKQKDKGKKKNKEGREIIQLEIRQDLKAMELPKNHLEAKGKVPQSGMLMLRDIIVGGVIGGRMGTGLGRFGLVAGGVAAGLGYYFGQPWMAGIGVGMAAGGMTAAAMANQAPVQQPPLQGFDFKTRWELAMARMKAFDAGVKKNLFLDKLTKGKGEAQDQQKEETPAASETAPVKGLGSADDPLAELEMQMASEAVNFKRENGPELTSASEFAGTDEEFDEEFEEEFDEDFEDEFEDDEFEDDEFEDDEEMAECSAARRKKKPPRRSAPPPARWNFAARFPTNPPRPKPTNS